jgi:DHA1 family multidrug resistance protein-like MFS transporter
MTSVFRDTLFAYILRSAFGSRVFRHEDEKSLPTIWQEKLSTQTSPRDSTQTTLNDAPKPDAVSTCSGPTQCADAPKKVDAEKGNDTLLVEWYGPTDPDVSYDCVMLVARLLTSIAITFRIRRTGRAGRRHG